MQLDLALVGPLGDLAGGRGLEGAVAGKDALGSPFRPVAQARSDVHRVADHRVLEATGRADVAGHNAARGHADAGGQVRDVSDQARAEVAAGGEGVRRGVGIGERCAEHAQRRVALELVDPAVVLGDNVDDDVEEAIEHRHDLGRVALLGQCRGALDIDEHDGGVPRLPAELDAALERVTHDLLADLTTEQITQVLALSQPGQHAIETGLEQPNLAAVVDGDLGVEVTLFDPFDRPAQRFDRVRERARQPVHHQRPNDEAESAEHDDRHREPLARESRLVKRTETHGDEPKEDHARPQHPRQEGARGDPGQSRSGGRSCRKGEGDHRPKLMLGDQEPQCARDETAEQQRLQDVAGKLDRERNRQRRVEHGGNDPYDGDDSLLGERKAQRRVPLGVGRWPVLLNPAHRGVERPRRPRPGAGEHDRAAGDERDHGDQFQGVLVMDRRPRKHEHEQQEHRHGPREVGHENRQPIPEPDLIRQ